MPNGEKTPSAAQTSSTPRLDSASSSQQRKPAAGLPQPADRCIALSGPITSVHAAIIDVIPRVAQFIKQARAKSYIGFGGTLVAGSLVFGATGRALAGNLALRKQLAGKRAAPVSTKYQT